MVDFIEKMAEIMEVEAEELSSDTVFREACEFDSMMGFSMICMIEDDYSKRISVEEFLDCKTISDLFQYVA